MTAVLTALPSGEEPSLELTLDAASQAQVERVVKGADPGQILASFASHWRGERFRLWAYAPHRSAAISVDDHTLRIDVRAASEAEVTAFSEAIVDRPDLAVVTPNERTRRVRRGYADGDLGREDVERAFATLMQALNATTATMAHDTSRETGAQAFERDELSALLAEAWREQKGRKKREKERNRFILGLRRGAATGSIDLNLVNRRLEIRAEGYDGDPNVATLYEALYDCAVSLDAAWVEWGPEPYRSGTIVWKLGRADTKTLARALRDAVDRFMADPRRHGQRPTIRLDPPGVARFQRGWRDPEIDAAYVTRREVIKGHGTVEELVERPTLLELRAAIEEAGDTAEFVGLGMTGTYDRTFNIEINLKARRMVAWSTEPLARVVHYCGPLAEALSAKQVEQVVGANKTADKTGAASALLGSGIDRLTKIAALTLGGGTVMATAVAFVVSAFFSAVEITHPVASGGDFTVPAPAEITLRWDVGWSLYRRVVTDAATLGATRVSVQVDRNGRATELGAGIAASGQNLPLAAPGIYRIDVAIGDLDPATITVTVVDPEAAKTDDDEAGD